MLNGIFDTFADSPYATTYVIHFDKVVHLFSVFTLPNHLAFEDSLAYKIMAANGPVWHVYDSTCPGGKEGNITGPQIIISSPGRAKDKEIKTVREGHHYCISRFPISRHSDAILASSVWSYIVAANAREKSIMPLSYISQLFYIHSSHL